MNNQIYIIEYDTEVVDIRTKDRYVKHVLDKRNELTSFKTLYDEIFSNSQVRQNSIRTYIGERIKL